MTGGIMKMTGLAVMMALTTGIVIADEPSVRLAVNLADGSRLIGSFPLASMAVRSRLMGETAIPLERIRLIECAEDHATVMITLLNGDKMKGTPVDAALPLDTLLGRVSIPWDKVTGITAEHAASAAALKDGLVASYPFQGDAEDHSGNRHHGKVSGADFENDGLRFRGDGGSYVRISRDKSLEPEEEFTISMWVKGVPGQEAGKGWGTVLRKMDHCGPGFGIRGGGVSAFNQCGENPCGGGRVTGAAFLPFDATRWQHIAATCSLVSGQVITYQNGAQVSESAVAVPLLHSGDIYIGGSDVSGDDGGFRGLIRDVRIYKRALQPAEIKALGAAIPAP